MEPYELTIKVAATDIDELGHVNNTVYLRWVQEVAVAHWRVIASPQAQEELHWMVVRHEIDYKQPARQGEEVILKTWVGTAAGLRFDRHTEVLRASDRQLLAVTKTVWCPIDPVTHRPKRVSAEVRGLFSVGVQV